MRRLAQHQHWIGYRIREKKSCNQIRIAWDPPRKRLVSILFCGVDYRFYRNEPVKSVMSLSSLFRFFAVAVCDLG